ncbi:hypothetical protein U3516DRAFT_67470 [Neocallimastix sp. 'constans']
MKVYIIILKKNLMHLYQLQSIKFNDDVRKSSIPLGIKPKPIFNEISQEMGFICS